MTVGHVVQYYIGSLSKIYDESEAKAITYFVMEETLKKSRADLRLNAEETISEVNANRLAYYLVRLLKHEPVQYILKTAYFCGLKFFVDENVLIPRPETEELVEWIAVEYGKHTSPVILDIGTGSGCIAIALKKKIPEAQIFAIDASEAALRIAEKNAESHSAEIKFFHCDILDETSISNFPEGIPAEQTFPKEFLQNKPPFDIIVSNPPYVLESEKSSLQKNVLFEPKEALFVKDDDALIFYKQIIQKFSSGMKNSGAFYFEINPLRAMQLKEWMERQNLFSAEIKKDLSGNLRMLKVLKTAIVSGN